MPSRTAELPPEITEDLMGSPGTSRGTYHDIETPGIETAPQSPVPLGNRFKHYATLAVSKNPVQYLRTLKDVENEQKVEVLLERGVGNKEPGGTGVNR